MVGGSRVDGLAEVIDAGGVGLDEQDAAGGQADDTASRSSAVSMDQFASFGGRLWPPFWSTLVKHPFAVVHAGNPYVWRKTPRSASAAG